MSLMLEYAYAPCVYEFTRHTFLGIITVMHGGLFIREARKRAGLSQRELAELMGTTQPVIARWETGVHSPTFERVVEAVRACGYDLAVRVVARDQEHRDMVYGNLRLSPRERLDRFTSKRSSIDDLAAQVTRRI